MQRYAQLVVSLEQLGVDLVEAARGVAKSTGNQMLGFFAELMAYFDRVGELGNPDETNQLLGAPETTLDAWIEQRKIATE